MNRVLFLILTLVSFQSFGSVLCDVTETPGDGQTYVRNINLQETDDPHGAVQMIEFPNITEVTGMVALYKDTMIIHMYHTPSGVASSSYTDLTTTDAAKMQFLVPGAESAEFSWSALVFNRNGR